MVSIYKQNIEAKFVISNTTGDAIRAKIAIDGVTPIQYEVFKGDFRKIIYIKDETDETRKFSSILISGGGKYSYGLKKIKPR